MHQANKTKSSYEKECHRIFPLAQESHYRVTEEPDLESFKEDIEAIKIPINIVGYWIITTVRTGMFFCHIP